MDNKIVVIAVVAVIAVAGVAAFFLFFNNGGGDSDEKGLAVIGRVNSEGSGILLVPGEDTTDYIAADGTLIASGWGGKVFATPGAATIQHVQLMDLASQMNLKFVSYSEGAQLKDDTLYYMPNVASFADFVNATKTAEDLVGYIIWEAQYSVGLENGYVGLALTNDLFPGHTCCIIGTSNKYIVKNKDVLETFLATYASAVDKINAALNNPTSADYATLINIAKNRVSMPDSMTDAQKEAAIKSALENVTYLYADNSSGSLSKLESDIAKLAEQLYNNTVIEKSPADLGFSSYADLADAFVKDDCMKEALRANYVKPTSMTTIKVAAIKGDIHQIALWYAYDTGMFEANNLDVVVSAQANGPGVYTQLANGESDIGFLGAPPMTIRCMNGEQIHA
jgi:ABC-type nitrate/sulfonate/bicarbonate transport system substrate-binding protein